MPARCCHPRTAPASHSRSPWALAIFFLSIYLPLLPPFPLSMAGSGQERRCTRAEFSPAFSKSGWHLLACQAGALNSFVKVQLRDHRAAPSLCELRVCVCVWQPPAAPAGLQDVSGWQRAPVCPWHPGRVLAAFRAGGGAVSEVYMNRYPASELDEFTWLFCFAARCCVTGSLRCLASRSGCGMRGRAGAGRVLQPRWDALGSCA